jgi:ACS family hexuronate transporter-like MFS transporter
MRWWICLLVFFACTINYIDRGVISYLKDDLQRDVGASEADYGKVVAAFSLAYAAGYLFGGRFVDLAGVRIGYAISVGLWSLAAGTHALARTVWQFQLARFGLGLSEGGNFPAAVKTVSEWFPKRERAFATGLFNAGTNIGAILTPILVTWIKLHYGWRACFIFVGSLGFIWLIAWWLIYRPPESHPLVSAEELALIKSDPPDPPVRVSWIGLLGYRPTWAFVTGMALSSPIWWFYLYWLPDFLKKTYNLTDQQRQWPLVVVFLISDVGSIAGGWLSSTLIQRGYSLTFARKAALLTCALCVVPVFFAPLVPGMWSATLLIALAAAAHQGFAANLYTLVSDCMPRAAVSSIVGIGGMSAGLVAMVFQTGTGYLLQWNKSLGYLILFAIGSCAYMTAVGVIHLLLPRIEPVPVSETAS